MSERDSPTLRQWLRAEPFALGMSSGFFGFFAHAGFMLALEQAELLPNALVGSSAGALVAGLWAGGVDAQQLVDELSSLRRDDFWDPSLGLGLLRGERFRQRLERMLVVSEFSQCRVPLSLSVFDVLALQTRVLNEGPLALAIQASCTFPFLFQPRMLAGRPLLDGGVLDRPGLQGMPTARRLLYHHLASRSPWRRKGSAALMPPSRPNMTSVVIAGLPRLGPFRLQRGMEAIDIAHGALTRALELPVHDGLMRV